MNILNYIPANICKKIIFPRLQSPAVVGYEVYAKYIDDKYPSGIRQELLEKFDNPVEPNICPKKILLEYSIDATWELPRDAYIDRDHQISLYFDDAPLPTMFFRYNRANKLITIDTVLKPYNRNNKIELEYYQDLIVRKYYLTEPCEIFIKPIFTDSHVYGTHNVII